jgi:hypothetical protein
MFGCIQACVGRIFALSCFGAVDILGRTLTLSELSFPLPTSVKELVAIMDSFANDEI